MEEEKKGRGNNTEHHPYQNAEDRASIRMLPLNAFLSKFQYQETAKQIQKTSSQWEGKMEDKNLKHTVSESDVGEKNSNLSLVKKEKNDAVTVFKKIPEEIIRPELNIEKHADFIFIPAHSKKVRQPRRREGWVALSDGSKETSYLEIAPVVGGKTPTTATRKIYLALQRLYEEKQEAGQLCPDGGMILSSREIARAAMLAWSGNKTIP